MTLEEVKEKYTEESEEEVEEETSEEVKELPEKKSDNLSAVVKQIDEEQDTEKLKDLTKLFNIAMMKKEINRAVRQSDVLDYAIEEVNQRLLTGDVSDKALGTYIKVLQDNINNVRKTTTEESLPVIQITKNEININNEESLTREERENIQKVIEMILTQSKDSDIIDVESQERETEEDD